MTNLARIETKQKFARQRAGIKWLGTRAGFPTLIAALALCASVLFNAAQLVTNQRQARELKSSLREGGSFRSGQLMDEIIAAATPSGDGDQSPLLIAVDYGSFGAFSHPKKFQEYLDVLRRRADNGRNVVRMVILDDQRDVEASRIQFKNFDAQKATQPVRDKMEQYMSGDYGRQAVRNLHLEAKLFQPEALTLDEWVSILDEVDDLVVADLRSWGVQISYYPHLLTVHLWIGNRDQALLTIVDFEGAVDEKGYIASGAIADNVRSIFEVLAKGATEHAGSATSGAASSVN